MRRRYKLIRIPQEAWEGFFRKRQQMEETLRKETRKNNLKLNMTDVMRFFSGRPVYVYNEELLNFFTHNKKKKQEGLQLA